MIRWFILGGLVGIVIKEIIHTAHLDAHLYRDLFDDIVVDFINHGKLKRLECIDETMAEREGE